jgi:hypothetical protein
MPKCPTLSRKQCPNKAARTASKARNYGKELSKRGGGPATLKELSHYTPHKPSQRTSKEDMIGIFRRVTESTSLRCRARSGRHQLTGGETIKDKLPGENPYLKGKFGCPHIPCVCNRRSLGQFLIHRRHRIASHVVKVPADAVSSRLKVGLLEDKTQARPFLPGLQVKGSTETEPWARCTGRGHRQLLVVANAEQSRESVLKRSLPNPQVKTLFGTHPLPCVWLPT